MTDQEKELIKYQKQYLDLINKITQLRLSGQIPSHDLLKEAQIVGRIAEIPEAFFKTL